MFNLSYLKLVSYNINFIYNFFIYHLFYLLFIWSIVKFIYYLFDM